MTRVETTVASIESLAQTGEGVAHVAERTLLVRGTLPGERVRLRIAGKGPLAELIELEEVSPDRLEPRCTIVDRCGGCTWQHVPAHLQREARLAQLRRTIPASMRPDEVLYHPAPAAYGYRTRARLAWHVERAGVSLGFRARGAHDIVDAAGCPVLAAPLEAALESLRWALRVLDGGGEAALGLGSGGRPVVVIRADTMPRDATAFELPRRLVEAGFAGASLWPPGGASPTVEGDPRPVATGGDGSPLFVAPGGFSQANDALNAHLATRVAERAHADGAAVLELFAGAGNFTVLLARDARRVTAVENDRAACEALRANVVARALSNVTVVEADAATIAASRKADVVVLDPPRTGARDACRALARTRTRTIVYVSCDPPTLGRDLAELGPGFQVTSLDAFEMFPQTPHVELVVRLERRTRSTS